MNGEVRDWTRSHANFFRAVQIEKRVMFIILTLIVAVAAFNIVSAQVMVVTDKQADIAILRTLGAAPSSVMAIFMQLLYSKNIGQNNNGCANIPDYDKLYEQSIRIPDSPERNRLYHEMARIIEVYAPWRLDVATYRNMLVQPRVQGYKKHPILHAEWQFIDVAPRR